jgi:hypothetical protein
MSTQLSAGEEEYRQLFEMEFDLLSVTIKQLQDDINARWKAGQLAEQRRRQPRVRKVENYKPLDDEFLETLRREFAVELAENDRLCKARLEARQRASDRMDELAEAIPKDVHPFGEWRKVESVSTAAYRTQGFGSYKYAREALRMSEQLAKHYGYEHAVYRQFSFYIEPRRYPVYGPGERIYDLQLWVNIEAWRWNAILRTPTFSTADFITTCDDHGVNPRVYRPFLPYSATGEVLREHRKKRYGRQPEKTT